MIDIDFFKKVNDSHGHTAGDEVLRQTASLLAANVRATDTVARLGGEEFVLLLPDTTLAGALALAEKIRVALAKKPLDADGQAIAVSASFGVSGLPAGRRASMEQLLTSADHALYDAKHKGRNRVEAATCEVARGPDGPARRQSREGNLTSLAPLADKWLPPH
jgi:diguanylate cyclase (GGDEF)-like protein